MKVLFSFIATAVAISLYLPAEASSETPADIETLDRLWQQYHTSCRKGAQKACQLRDNYRIIIKQNFPNAVPAFCPPDMKRVWFETGRKGINAGCEMVD